MDFLARTHRHIAALLKRSSYPAGTIAHDPASAGSASSSLFDNVPEIGPGSGTSPLGGRDGFCGGRRGAKAAEVDKSLLRPAMTYDEYASRCAKRAPTTTARDILGAMVRQAPGCSAARAKAVVRAFQSPLGFLLALERTGGGGDDTVKIKNGEQLLGELRCSGGAGTNKLPQPLRRLLCRLFIGESVLVVGGQGRRWSEGGGNGDKDWDVEPMSQESC